MAPNSRPPYELQPSSLLTFDPLSPQLRALPPSCSASLISVFITQLWYSLSDSPSSSQHGQVFFLLRNCPPFPRLCWLFVYCLFIVCLFKRAFRIKAVVQGQKAHYILKLCLPLPTACSPRTGVRPHLLLPSHPPPQTPLCPARSLAPSGGFCRTCLQTASPAGL